MEIEKQQRPQRPPSRETEKPREFKPQERTIEKPGEKGPGMEIEKQQRPQRPPSRETEKPREFKPEERGIERPGERSPEQGIEKPKENHRPLEMEKRSPGRESRPAPRQFDRPAGQRTPERGRERIREEKPIERGPEKPREIKSQGKEIEKLQGALPREFRGVKLGEGGSRGENTASRGQKTEKTFAGFSKRDAVRPQGEQKLPGSKVVRPQASRSSPPALRREGRSSPSARAGGNGQSLSVRQGLSRSQGQARSQTGGFKGNPKPALKADQKNKAWQGRMADERTTMRNRLF
jgi:hypothetical protein